MMCYKDKCFCRFYYKCLQGKDCHRALTMEVLQEKSRIEKETKCNLPIDQFNTEPDCFEVKK